MNNRWSVPVLLAAVATACAPSDAQDMSHMTHVSTGFGAEYVAKLEAAQTHGEWVTYASGKDSVRAYIAYPASTAPAPAIVVIHEIFGLSDWIRTVVDDFASHGYVAISPDLLTRRGGTQSA